MSSDSHDLPIETILYASRTPHIIEAVGDLLSRAEHDIAKHGILCQQCGRCCRFGEYGHRMFVTPLELAYLLAKVENVTSQAGTFTQNCIFQGGSSCTIYPHRLLCCRIFLCKLDGKGVVFSPGEKWHRALVELHETLCIPYYYVEWPDAINRLAKGQS
ncbi:MAG: YkgJ family cysteine cluster protein [Phycisphaerae bacterium]|nr:YkgJ family cysteine cluster protein [Phycisphaerae bacterium]